MGLLVQVVGGRSKQSRASNIYGIAVVPCFDKAGVT